MQTVDIQDQDNALLDFTPLLKSFALTTDHALPIRTDRQKQESQEMARRMKNWRQRPRRQDRLLPCVCCAWPITESHHILLQSKYGEGERVRLCANCHDLFHLLTDRQGPMVSAADGSIPPMRWGEYMVAQVAANHPDVVMRVRDIVAKAEGMEARHDTPCF